MTVSLSGLDPIFKKFPSISGEADKIATALAAQERGSRLAGGFLAYAHACHKLIDTSAPLRKTHKDLDAALQTLSGRVNAAYAKIASSELQAALRDNDVKTVAKILKISNLKNIKIPNGEMPLHYAIRSGSLDVVKYLLSESRVNPLAKDHQGLTAFDHSYISKSSKMTALVMGAALGTSIPESALDLDVDFAELQILGQEMALFRRPPVARLQPLYAAAFLGDLQGLEKLSKETELHSEDQNGMTALHYAALGGKEDAVKWLIAKKAKLDGKAANGMNLLHLAAISGSETVMKILLDMKKLDLNAVDKRGRTPLHFALASERLDIGRTLIQRGADPFATNTMKTSPFALLNFLSSRKAEYRDPLKLDSASLLIFGSYAASALCHYFGKADGDGFRKFLSQAGTVMSALPALRTLVGKCQSGPVWQRQLAWMSFLPTLGGYFYDDRSVKSFVEGVHTLSLGKTWVDNMRLSWKNSGLETYRPLRNAALHSANALFSLSELLQMSGIKKKMVCQLGSHKQCILQDDLKPKYEHPKECRELEDGLKLKLDQICDPSKRDGRVITCQVERDRALVEQLNICAQKHPKNTTIRDACKTEAILNSPSRLHCEQFVPVEEKEACEARVKPELDMQLKQCRQMASKSGSVGDAKTILDLSGDPDPKEAKRILLEEFPDDQEIRAKINQAYDTTVAYPLEFDCTGISKDQCIKKAAKLRSMKEPIAREVLGLEKGHTKEECREAAKKLEKEYAPDSLTAAADVEKKQELANLEQMRRIESDQATEAKYRPLYDKIEDQYKSDPSMRQQKQRDLISLNQKRWEEGRTATEAKYKPLVDAITTKYKTIYQKIYNEYNGPYSTIKKAKEMLCPLRQRDRSTSR